MWPALMLVFIQIFCIFARKKTDLVSPNIFKVKKRTYGDYLKVSDSLCMTQGQDKGFRVALAVS